MRRVRHETVGAWLLLLAWSLLLPTAALGQAESVEGVVLSESGPAHGVVVHLDMNGDAEAPATEPDTTVIDQYQLRFVPPVVAGRRGLTVDFLNSDEILHNVFSPGWSGGEAFDLGTYPADSSRSHTFSEPGPHVILCHVHPEMVAYVVVVTTPYYDVTDAEGRFVISGVPPGSYRLSVWRRGSDPLDETLVVPVGGVTDLVLDLSEPGRLPREAGR